MLAGLFRERPYVERLETFARAQWIAQIHFVVPVETRAQPPIRGETHAVARATVRVRHRRDHTNRSGRAGKSIVLGRSVAPLRSTVRVERAQRRQPRQYLIARHYMIPGERA